ncbi:hypothetical protein DFS34DRAFT_251563 [Phlyctochytrium arcticum]|nr:hypothetical protein DFS34DRAFT_251563 [Phlyctochytrium arcticum]
MKFGKYIQAQQTDWAGPQYLNYKGLKKIINSLKAPPEHHQSAPRGSAINEKNLEEYKALKTEFFFKLERELEKVNKFYLQKEADLKVRLRSLVDKERISRNAKSRQRRASFLTLREGFIQYQHDLTKLQRFVEVNATGFRKILKKWDKRSKSSTKELYLSRQVEIQPCFNNDVLAELTDQATIHLADIENNLSEEDSSPTHQNIREATSIGTVFETDVEGELTGAVNSENPIVLQEFLRSSHWTSIPDAESAHKEWLSRAFLGVCVDASDECLQVLLDTAKVDCSYSDDITGRTCLHEASVAGRLSVLQKALQRGAKVEATDVYGRTALHYSVMNGQSDCTEFLLLSGANVNSIDHDGCTALVHGITSGHTKCVEMLIAHNAVVEPQSPTAPIPLSLACQHGQKDIVLLLLKKGAQLAANAEGLFPLHLTSREGHAEITQVLISHGADVNGADHFNGWTPIFYAASEGHLMCAKVLLNAGCHIDTEDEHNWTPWTYALYRGHIRVAKLLERPNVPKQMSQSLVATRDSGIQPMAPSALFFQSNVPAPVQDDAEIDQLPDLSLPPPIIPFRIYGHAFLDKKCYVQITFRSTDFGARSPISLIGTQSSASLKMAITSRPEVGIPYSVILPPQDDLEVYTFSVEDISQFSLQFDVYPTFGTKPIGRAVALASQLSMVRDQSWNGAGESETIICPLFDTHLRVVGEISFGYAVVKPFVHPSLRIGGKVETYWKTTKVVGGNKAADGVHSFITASSLAEEYIQVVVQPTADGVPVLYSDWYLPMTRVSLGVASTTFAQARDIHAKAQADKSSQSNGLVPPSPNTSMESYLTQSQRWTTQDLAKLVCNSMRSLREVLMSLPSSVGISIVLKYPTSSERAHFKLNNLPDINSFVDAVLQNVYDHAAHRSIIFSSFNPSVCTAVNWKQPNYGVFFGTRCGFGYDDDQSGSSKPTQSEHDAQAVGDEYDDSLLTIETDVRCSSIKEAIKFAKSNKLLGVVCEATPLVQMPTLIQTIKESGLILATCGSANDEPANVSIQEENGVDAIVVNHIFRYNVT